jgi:hypothetical protein
MTKNPTTIVNVRVAFIRPQYDNLQEWVNDPNNVYIGRKGVVFINGCRFPENDSIWANPFKIGRDGDRETVLQKYKEYITARVGPAELKKLAGKNLGCWCKPEPCHGDILIELINEYDF